MVKRWYSVLISIIGVYYFSTLYAQYQWAKLYGGGHHEGVYALRRTSDGGYIIAGETRSFGQGNSDLFIMKLNSTGGVVWTRTYGGIDPDDARSVLEVSDGYIIAGTHRGFSPLPLDYNIYVIKVNFSGQAMWGKEIGTGGGELGYGILPASDGGYIILGRTSVSPQSDFIVIKLNPNGSVSWAKTYGGSSYEYEPRLIKTSDGGYLLTGETWSFGSWKSNFLVIKLDQNGNVVWSRVIGISYYDDVPTWVEETQDGGFIIVGRSKIYVQPYMHWDPVAIKLNSSGGVVWAKRYEIKVIDQSYDVARCCKQTSDGGYVIAGSYEVGVYNSRSFLLKIDANGNLIWGRRYNTINNGANCVDITPDGGYVIGGGLITDYTDAYILKTNSQGLILFPSGEICEGFPFSPTVISEQLTDNSSVQVTVSNWGHSVYDTILPSTTPNLNISTECEVVGINEGCEFCKSHTFSPVIVSNIGKEFNIKYSLRTDTYLSIKLYNSAGNLIWTLFEGKKEKGRYNLIVDAKNLKPGSYFCIIKQDEEINKFKIIITP